MFHSRARGSASKGSAVYPGSFDPITNGHLDIIRRARELFGSVTIAVSNNSVKNPSFSLNERQSLIIRSLRERRLTQGVRVEVFDGLLTDYMRRRGASVVIRGLRFISDFESELQMALMNRRLNPAMDTVYLMPDEKHIYLSSSLVKEIARLGKNPKAFAPACVAKALMTL
ncbi:MAG: pantetheine-phosphate adenylyltransferase [Elusimicrobia bacterium]|nr:pantetheine-phosphate adenylyltransferase [Elusimicrobiota bacterium]